MANPSKSLYHNYFGISAGVPSGVTAENGDLYYDSGTNVMMCYINGVWTPLGTGAGGVQDVYAELYYYGGRCGSFSTLNITPSATCSGGSVVVTGLTAGQVKGAPYITVNAANGQIIVGASGAGLYRVTISATMGFNYTTAGMPFLHFRTTGTGVIFNDLSIADYFGVSETSYHQVSVTGVVNLLASTTYDVIVNEQFGAPTAVRFLYFNVNVSRIPPSGLATTGNATLTPEGGQAIRLTNNTGANSVKGTLVIASTAVDNAFVICPANGFQPIGVVYESGIANGSPCWVVVGGIAEVLLEDTVASTRGNWCRTSITVAGRMDATGAGGGPGFVAQHFAEVGHCLESKAGGTSILCKIAMHFN